MQGMWQLWNIANAEGHGCLREVRLIITRQGVGPPLLVYILEPESAIRRKAHDYG
jgi:hypothetical protein